MRKLLVVLISALLLSAAFAQEDETVVVIDDQPTESYWAGLSVGYPGVNFHFGIDDAIGQDIDVRANLGVTYFASFSIGADALFELPVEVDPGTPITLYAGGGPFLGFYSDVEFGINLLAGGEYRLTEADFPSGGVFLEVGPQLVFTGFDAAFLARLGFNYHF